MNGFRFIDTANQPRHYHEAGVGEGWNLAAKELGLKRENIHIQTKFTPIDGQDPNNIPYDKSADLSEFLFIYGQLYNTQKVFYTRAQRFFFPSFTFFRHSGSDQAKCRRQPGESSN